MPKTGGKKKNSKNKPTDVIKRTLELATDMQQYAKVIKSLGDRKVTLSLTDGTEILGIIPGRFRKRVWITSGDIVIVSRRDFQDNKVDIVYKYNNDEIKALYKKNEIPSTFVDTMAVYDNDSNDDMYFDENSEGEAMQVQNPRDLPSMDSSDDEDVKFEDI